MTKSSLPQTSPPDQTKPARRRFLGAAVSGAAGAVAMTAPMITARPIPPNPKTATVLPGSTLAVLSTAPMPVVTPQPSRQTFSSGASLLILATAISGTTVYSQKVEVPM